jgi:hypothetical protein
LEDWTVGTVSLNAQPQAPAHPPCRRLRLGVKHSHGGFRCSRLDSLPLEDIASAPGVPAGEKNTRIEGWVACETEVFLDNLRGYLKRKEI